MRFVLKGPEPSRWSSQDVLKKHCCPKVVQKTIPGIQIEKMQHDDLRVNALLRTMIWMYSKNMVVSKVKQKTIPGIQIDSTIEQK